MATMREQAPGGSTRKKDRAYAYLKEAVLAGDWKPGDEVDVNAVCERLGMSRTPVHEALSRLEQEGFVVIVPQVGVMVRVPDVDEVREHFLARAALEGLLAEFAAACAGADELDALSSIVTAMSAPGQSIESYAELNEAFHRRVHAMARLPYIERMVLHHWDAVTYVAVRGVLFQNRQARSLHDHVEIVERLRAGDGAGARAKMEAHVRNAGEVFVAHLRDQRSKGRGTDS